MLGRNLRSLDEDSNGRVPQGRPLRQSHFQRMQRAIAGILQLVYNAKVDAARGSVRNSNVRLPVIKVVTGAQRMHAASGEEAARAQRKEKADSHW